MISENDAVALLVRYAPDPAAVPSWTPERARDVIASVQAPVGAAEPAAVESTGPSSRPRRTTRWAPALAAACVLALVIGLGVAFRGGNGPDDAGGDAPTLAVHPWHARAIRSLDVLGTMLPHDGHLYALTGDGTAVREIDPVTGAVLAEGRTSGAQLGGGSPVWAGGRVWVSDQLRSQQVQLTSFAPDLSQRRTLTYSPPVVDENIAFDLAAPVDGSALYLATGEHVLVLDPRTGRIAGRIAVSAGDISVSPDGRTLYAADRRSTAVKVVDTRSRHVVRRISVRGATVRDSEGDGTVGGLAATDHGLFLDAEIGHQPNLTRFFYPARSTGRVQVHVGYAAGIASPTHATGGVSWGSEGTRLSCVDPATGRVLARSDAIPERISIGVTDLDGRLYGSYTDQDSATGRTHTAALIELTPPAACGLR